jgi:hypothetical protein
VLLTIVFVGCAAEPQLAYKNYPRPSIPATRFVEGADGARCMADALRATALARNVRVDTFQDFDVAFPVLEYTIGPQTVRVIVVSTAPAIMATRASLANLENIRDRDTQIAARARFELQISELEAAHYHFYGPGADVLPPTIGTIWEAKCKARMTPPPSLGPGPGHGNLGPEDFALKGQFDFEALRPLLKPTPLTPVDIR